MKSVMNKDFSRVAQTDIERSTFDRGHGLKTAFNSGYLVPVELQEVVPGDSIKFSGRFLARLAPVVTPVMDNVFLDLQAFFVPTRLVWTNFTKMMGERVNPSDSIDFTVPTVELGTADCPVGGLADYFGLPVQQVTGLNKMEVSVLPFRCYQKIWDDWYRDENLQNSVIQSTTELGDTTDSLEKWLTLRKRGKRHDYFTSCLPSPQKGAGVSLPLGSTAPVVGNGHSLGLTNGDGEYGLAMRAVTGLYSPVILGQDGTVGDTATSANPTGTKLAGVVDDPKKSGLVVDLSDATAATINSLRMAFQLQRLLEADARGGTRYVEIIRNHFKTICPDARLQRSEFLGSASIPVTFSPVAQTSATGENVTPQGNLAATAHAYGEFVFDRAFTEHGYIIILASVRCDLNYQQGIDRLWSRKGRYDFYWPTLAHLGEQEVLNKEIFFSGDTVVDAQERVVDDLAFGYQERYAEMRYNPSRITGWMRSGITGSLDVWHLAQSFANLPVLSDAFIQENPPLDRVLAVTEGTPQILLDAYLGQFWTRPMPVYSIPGLVDHF